MIESAEIWISSSTDEHLAKWEFKHRSHQSNPPNIVQVNGASIRLCPVRTNREILMPMSWQGNAYLVTSHLWRNALRDNFTIKPFTYKNSHLYHFTCEAMATIIDLLRKSRNAPVSYQTVHNFVREMCTRVHNCYKTVHYEIFFSASNLHCELGLLLSPGMNLLPTVINIIHDVDNISAWAKSIRSTAFIWDCRLESHLIFIIFSTFGVRVIKG